MAHDATIVWFRQDLRLEDNPAFSEACGARALSSPLCVRRRRRGHAGAEGRKPLLAASFA